MIVFVATFIFICFYLFISGDFFSLLKYMLKVTGMCLVELMHIQKLDPPEVLVF